MRLSKEALAYIAANERVPESMQCIHKRCPQCKLLPVGQMKGGDSSEYCCPRGHVYFICYAHDEERANFGQSPLTTPFSVCRCPKPEPTVPRLEQIIHSPELGDVYRVPKKKRDAKWQKKK